MNAAAAFYLKRRDARALVAAAVAYRETGDDGLLRSMLVELLADVPGDGADDFVMALTQTAAQLAAAGAAAAGVTPGEWLRQVFAMLSANDDDQEGAT